MGCSSTRKSCYDKSCQRYFNNQTQTFAIGDTLQLQIAGSKVVDSGIAIDTDPMNYTILKTGLYNISADVSVATTAVGIATLTAYLDGVPLPCTRRNITLVNGTTEIHTETDLEFKHCCPNISKSITFVLEDPTVAGSVVQVCTRIIKEA